MGADGGNLRIYRFVVNFIVIYCSVIIVWTDKRYARHYNDYTLTTYDVSANILYTVCVIVSLIESTIDNN